MSDRRHITIALFVALLFTACSTGPELVKIEESPQGAVYLKRISDGSLEAAHPIKIDSATIALMLSGMLIREHQPAPSSGGSVSRPVFSGSQVGYLAPLISEGLRRAASDQQVGFRIGQLAEPGLSQRVGASVPSTTAVLYAYGRSLYVTLTQYHSPEEAATASKTADTTGLANRTLSFVPEAAKRPDTYLDARSTDRTLVIDYALLDRLPPAARVPASAAPTPTPQSSPAAPPSSADEGKANPAKKDSEIEALRKELEEIKKQLAEQQAERARSQP